jgi:hypothetical protein
MTRQQGRDGEEVTTRRDGMTDLSDVSAVEVDSTELSDQQETGPGMGTASAMRISETTGGMGADVGDDEGMGAGADMDLATSRGDAPGTGTSQRAGLGGQSSGSSMDVDPAAGSGMANPADMGDQG